MIQTNIKIKIAWLVRTNLPKTLPEAQSLSENCTQNGRKESDMGFRQIGFVGKKMKFCNCTSTNAVRN